MYFRQRVGPHQNALARDDVDQSFLLQAVQGLMDRGAAKVEVADNLSAQGADPVGNSPAEFGAFIKAEMKRYETVVRNAGVTTE